jgi:hypothetical protein
MDGTSLFRSGGVKHKQKTMSSQARQREAFASLAGLAHSLELPATG